MVYLWFNRNSPSPRACILDDAQFTYNEVSTQGANVYRFNGGRQGCSGELCDSYLVDTCYKTSRKRLMQG